MDCFACAEIDTILMVTMCKDGARGPQNHCMAGLHFSQYFHLSHRLNIHNHTTIARHLLDNDDNNSKLSFDLSSRLARGALFLRPPYLILLCPVPVMLGICMWEQPAWRYTSALREIPALRQQQYV